MVWHVETLKYSHQPEEPKALVELFTYIRVQVVNILTHIDIFRHIQYNVTTKIGGKPGNQRKYI